MESETFRSETSEKQGNHVDSLSHAGERGKRKKERHMHITVSTFERQFLSKTTIISGRIGLCIYATI